MKTFNKIGLGVALVGSTLAFSAVGMSSAQAFVSGEFNFGGNANILNSAQLDPATEQISFTEAFVLPGATGSFAALTPLNPGELILSNMEFTRTGLGAYDGMAGNPFISAPNADWTFDIENPFTAVRNTSVTAGGLLTSITTSFAGQFVGSDGVSLGQGILTANNISDGSFSATLAATKVPEPTTTLGLAALGLGAFFTSSMAKKKKEKVNA